NEKGLIRWDKSPYLAAFVHVFKTCFNTFGKCWILSKEKAMRPSFTTESPLVVLNPTANRGRMSIYRELVRRRAADEGARYVETTRAGEAEELAGQAANEGRPVIVVGG